MTPLAHPELIVEHPSSALSLQELRRWCAPETILSVTDLNDEENVLFHTISQARRSAARVLIAHVLPGGPASRTASTLPVPARNAAAVDLAQRTLERMARKIRWVGISCEPVLLRGDAAEEVIGLARAHSVNRVLLTGWRDRSPLARTLAEEIAPWVGVPVCVVPSVSAQGNEHSSAHIVLAVSLRSGCETSLALAARLAQHHRARLTVVHVFDGAGAAPATERSSAAVASQLPAGALQEAEMLGPVEVVARTGDPTSELLKLVAEKKPDFLLMSLPRSPYPDQAAGASLVSGIMHQAHCPVMLLSRRAVQLCSPGELPPLSVPA